MSFILIDHEGGVIHGLYSTRPGLPVIKDYTPDDESDALHDWQFAACSYITAHGALSSKLEPGNTFGTRIWAPLERPSETQTLLVREFPSEIASDRALDAAFAAGYLEAAGDLTAWIHGLDEPQRTQVYSLLEKVQDRMYEKFHDFCGTINGEADM